MEIGKKNERSWLGSLGLSLLIHIGLIVALFSMVKLHQLPQQGQLPVGSLKAVMIDPNSLPNLKPQKSPEKLKQTNSKSNTSSSPAVKSSQATLLSINQKKPTTTPAVTTAEKIGVVANKTPKSSLSTPLIQAAATHNKALTTPHAASQSNTNKQIKNTTLDTSSNNLAPNKAKSAAVQTNKATETTHKVSSATNQGSRTTEPKVLNETNTTSMNIQNSDTTQTKVSTQPISLDQQNNRVKPLPKAVATTSITRASSDSTQVKPKSDSVAKPSSTPTVTTVPSKEHQVLPSVDKVELSSNNTPSDKEQNTSSQAKLTAAKVVKKDEKNTPTQSNKNHSDTTSQSDIAKKQSDSVNKAADPSVAKTAPTIIDQATAPLLKDKEQQQQVAQLFSSLATSTTNNTPLSDPKISEPSKNEVNSSRAAASSEAVSQSELDEYNSAIVHAIENQFKNPGLYKGKQCILHIKLASDGLVLSATEVSGDPALCREALAAIKTAKIPAPFSPAVYDKFKNTTILFKLD